MHRVLHSMGCGVAVFCLAALHAQQPAPAGQTPVFRGGTTLVQLDVVVTDGAGKPVAGLTKSDFRILAAGRERPIVAALEYHHDAPAGALIRRDVASSSLERLVVVVLDDSGKFGERLNQAKSVARQIIRTLAGRAQMALVRTSLEPGVEFTPNAQELLDALDLLPTIQKPIVPPSGSWGTLQSLLLRNDIYIPGDQARESRNRIEPEFNSTPATPGPTSSIAYRAVGGTTGPRIENTLYHAFADGLLSANDGRRKSFIVITEGGIYSRLRGLFIEDEVKRLDQGKLDDKQLMQDLHERLQHVWNAASRTNSAVSIIDPRLADTGRTVSGIGPARLQRASLEALAQTSGGYSALNYESLDEAMGRVVSDLDHYYVLGFEPADPKNPKASTVEVGVNRPGATVRARTTYQLDETARTRAMTAAKKDPLLGLAYSPIATSDLPLRLWATVLPPASASGAAPIALWLDSGDRTIKEYAVFILDMKKRKEVGKPLGRKLTGIPPTVLPLEAPALLPGHYQVRVAARDETAGGSVYLTVTVPEFANMALAVTGLVLGEEFYKRPDTGPLPFTPTLSRVFSPRATLRVGFRVWRAAPASDVQAAIELVDASGTTIERLTQVVDTSDVRGVGERLSLPAKAGLYLLRVSAISGTVVASEEIGIEVKNR